MSVTKQQTLTLLADTVQEVAGVPASEVRPERSLVDDLGLDSLAMVTVVFALEEKTGASVAEEELAGVTTVQDLLDVISRPTESS